MNKTYPKIVQLSEKILLGKCLKMSYSQNKTVQLWQSFMPLKKHIKNTVGNDVYSVQVYEQLFDYNSFDLEAQFTKWATIEVSDEKGNDLDLQKLELEGGLYAVFLHKGSSSDFQKTFESIFKDWLPISEYVLDARPHFEVLGDNYQNNHPDSEEEIWIPIKIKNQ